MDGKNEIAGNMTLKKAYFFFSYMNRWYACDALLCHQNLSGVHVESMCLHGQLGLVQFVHHLACCNSEMRKMYAVVVPTFCIVFC
jgi:hypothetical protein